MKYKAIFFDWGGVIAHDPGPDFLRDILMSVGATKAQWDEIYMGELRGFMRGEISEQAFWELLRTKYNLAIHDTISDEFKKWKGLEASQAMLDFARTAKAAGIKIAVLSNVIEPTYNVIQAAGYYDLFDDVIASCKVGYVKPDEEIYKIALERLGVSAQESIFIDDKERCIAPAAKLGFMTILAESPEQALGELHKLTGL
ncbi:MAG TPA: HAD family phosphatase [Candidatus Saccharimonadales bacterium]